MTATALVILADDLTGASDAAIPFARLGARASVCLELPRELDAVDVAALDLDTRTSPPGDAAERIRSLARALPPRTQLVKKIDSTLRGNIRAEIEALLDARDGALAIVVPAHPKLGRVQRDGLLFLDGTPVHETDFGDDLFAPVRTSDVRAHLPQPAVVLPAPSTLGNALEHEVAQAARNGARSISIDARSEDDLRAIAALAAHDERYLWVGSAGLLEALAPVLLRDRKLTGVANPRDAIVSPVLFAIGSLSAMTRLQIAAFARAGGVTELVDPRTILIDEGGSRAAAIAHRIESALGSGRDVLAALSSDRVDVQAALSMGRLHGFDVRATSRELRERFVEVVMPSLARVGSVVLSGADIARTFLRVAGIESLSLVGEAAPDIALARAAGHAAFFIPKGGGAGIAQTYRDIASRAVAPSASS